MIRPGSTIDQDLTAQRDALAALGVEPKRVCVDHGLTGALLRWLFGVPRDTGEHYTLTADLPVLDRVRVAFDDLALSA